MMKMLRGVAAALALGACLSGCALYNSILTKTPLTPAEVQADLNTANYLLAASCPAFKAAAAAAAPIVAIAGDANGQQVLTATAASGAIICTAVVPPTALPVPAQPNAPPAIVPAAATS